MKLKQFIGAILFSTPLAVLAVWAGCVAPTALVSIVVFVLVIIIMALGLGWINK